MTTASESVENGEIYAAAIAGVLSVGALAIYVWLIYVAYYDSNGVAIFAILVAAGFIIAVTSWFIFNWILLIIFLPGTTYPEMVPGDEAARNVSATHLGFLALISLALYKICGKKEAAKKVEAPATANAEIDYLINSIE